MSLPLSPSLSQAPSLTAASCVCEMGADFCTKFPPDCGEILKKEKDFNHSSSCKLYLKSREKLIQEGGCNDHANTGWVWMIPKTDGLTFELLLRCVTTAGGRATHHKPTQLLPSACASASSIKWGWKYLKLLRETLQVVLVEFHNVFDEVLDGHRIHVICRRTHRASCSYETWWTM